MKCKYCGLDMLRDDRAFNFKGNYDDYLMHKKGKVVGFIKNFSNLIYIIINDKGYIINKFGVKKV